MGQLEDMAMFVRIVEAGGIGKAAEQLELAKSAVSRRLNALEKRLCTQLLTRTTRKSSLTDAGALYYERSLNILADVAALNDQASGAKVSVAGTLKMTAPLSFGLLHLAPVIDEFARDNTHLDFQIDFSDQHKDLVEEGYELAIRIGELEDSSFQAKRITPVRHVLCASPDYLQEMGEPEELVDLDNHRLLQYGMASHSAIQLTDHSGKQHQLQIKTRMKANNGDFLKQMALCGHGIVYAPTFLCYQEIAAGELVPILGQYQLPVMHAYAVYPKNRFLSQRCRLLIDFIAEYFGDEPYWDQ
jgi:DNA-binding transcriptional LysR family regulator